MQGATQINGDTQLDGDTQIDGAIPNWVRLNPYQHLDAFRQFGELTYQAAFRNFSPSPDQSSGIFYFEREDGLWVQHNFGLFVVHMEENSCLYDHQVYWGKPKFDGYIGGHWYVRPTCSLTFGVTGRTLTRFDNHSKEVSPLIYTLRSRAHFFWNGATDSSEISYHQLVEWRIERQGFVFTSGKAPRPDMARSDMASRVAWGKPDDTVSLEQLYCWHRGNVYKQ